MRHPDEAHDAGVPDLAQHGAPSAWGCVWGGMRMGPASGRLIAARWLVIALSSLPAHVAARAMIASGPGRSPWFTMEEPPIPFVHLVRLFGEVPGAFTAAIATAGVAVVADQVLLAAAVVLLGKAGMAPRAPRLLPALRNAATWLRPFLGLAIVALAAGGAGAAVARALGRLARTHGEASGWSGMTVELAIPIGEAALAAIWMAAVAAWLLWSRVLLVMEEPGPLRAARSALRLIRDHPLVALGFPVLLTTGCLAASSWMIAAWLAAEPATDAGVAGWTAGMLAVVAAQCFAWHWMVHAACLVVRRRQPRILAGTLLRS